MVGGWLCSSPLNSLEEIHCCTLLAADHSEALPLLKFLKQHFSQTHVRSGDARRSAGVIDWCADATPNSREGGGSCDSVPSPRGQPDWRPVNRHTLSWNVAAAWWAYAYAQLSTLPGARVVGQDQLVAGPYPDNVRRTIFIII